MSYEVLARKLRPAGFGELVGQDHVVRALKHGLDNDRLHHAYLFTGTRGVGKTTIARILAKALNCETGVSATPCEQCSVCTQVKENRFVDLIEVDAASRTGVDDTRELLENAQYAPTVGRYKVYLIDEVHMLSTASFNALLKTLEEPPEHVKFLLATTDPKKVPATVLSRCLQFQLKNMSRETIVAYLQEVLQKETVTFDDAALSHIARAASGSMRDALSLTDQAIAYGNGSLLEADVVQMLGVVGQSEVATLMAALAQGQVTELLTLCATLAEENADFADVLQGITEYLHRFAVDIALQQVPVDAPNFDAEEVQLFYQIALMGQKDLDLAPEPRTGFEMTMLRMLSFTPNKESETRDRANSAIKDNSPVQEQQGAAIEPAQAAEVSTAKKPEASSSAQPETKPAQPIDTDWHELVERLDLGGITKMIVDNCVPEKMAVPDVQLVLDQRHETLLSDAQTEIIKRALEEALESKVSLAITLGTPSSETPAARQVRERQERQAAAEDAINQDPKVSSLLADFDGSIEGIEPA